MKVYYPFPFVVLGTFAFIIIAISEIVTNTVSRFKEAFIAMLSLCEVGCWIAFLVFHFLEFGYLGSFALGAMASLVYIMLNLIHACVHPRRIVPNSEQSYKVINRNYRCSTMLVRLISYFETFKFSLLLVSYFFMWPRFKGDYSKLNWKQFNRFSLAFMIFNGFHYDFH